MVLEVDVTLVVEVIDAVLEVVVEVQPNALTSSIVTRSR